jgi:DNA-directed RNA polymerase subunit RPC12/RpoP
VKFKSINFTCESCGAPLRYSPITTSLRCEFCSNTKEIPLSKEHIKEYDFNRALQFLERQKRQEIHKSVKCNKCAVSFELTPYSISSNCPYCGTPAITDFVQEITPKSILPFSITEKEATQRFRAWIGSLWFAPNKLKDFVDGDERLIGYYLPHWTYDSQTQTHYQGQRGVIYYVTVERTVVVNGRQQRVRQQEPRINWTPVQGRVVNNFDDITIGASKTISHAILDNLAPWDTHQLVPFDRQYLAGFESEEYTIGLDNGFEYAKMKMDRVIRQDIKRDIGGDQQQIDTLNTQHHNTTYKNALFPVWIAGFKWKGKLYNYAINGQSGEVVGERPYSWVKIIGVASVVLTIFGVSFYFEEHPQIIQEMRETIILYQR